MRKLWLAGLVAVLIAGAVVWVVAGRGADRPDLPADSVSPPGTRLPDGFSVPDGALLLGPVLLRGTQGDPAAGWTAVLAVEGKPLDAWKRLAGRIAERYPGSGVDASAAPGCRAPAGTGLVCELSAYSKASPATMLLQASLSQPADDVTGRYLIVLSASRLDLPPGMMPPTSESPAWRGGEAPAPRPARRAPEVGEPLAPSSVAYPSDDRRYVVLEGSELLAQWGEGSLTGGFDVLLRTTGIATAEEVAEAYAEQATQYEGPAGVEQYRSGRTAFTRYLP
ncbi:MAG TPA: hypothetical protein VHJ78_03865, partial [Actinomycetota bacterium]|nr:hypothetical protein [Actinomycetota bacterium]